MEEVVALTLESELAGKMPANDILGRMLQKSYCAERSGDVAMVTKPYYLVQSTKTGTGHGSPHFYDTHVPLMVFGAGHVHGRCNEPVTPQAAAIILTWAGGIPAPAQADTPLPATLNEP